MISNVFTYYNNLNYSNKNSIYNCYCNKQSSQQQPNQTSSKTNLSQSSTFEPPAKSIPIIPIHKQHQQQRHRVILTEPNSPTTQNNHHVLSVAATENNTVNHSDVKSPMKSIQSQSLNKSSTILIKTQAVSILNGMSLASSSSNANNKNKASDISSTSSSFNSPSNLYLKTGLYATNHNNNGSNSDNNNINRNLIVAAHNENPTRENSSLNIKILGSSVPTNCGSYVGMYKRFMRSISNSLISSNDDLAGPYDCVSSSSNNNNNNKNYNYNGELSANATGDMTTKQFENILTETGCGEKRAETADSSERISLSGVSNGGNQATLCEKCVENNSYPKYKIGVSIIFCLPNESVTSSKKSVNTPNTAKAKTSPVMSPFHSTLSHTSQTPSPLSLSNPLTYIPFLNSPRAKFNSNNKSRINFRTADNSRSDKNLFDPLILFPATSSSSNSPNSPPNSPNSSSAILHDASSDRSSKNAYHSGMHTKSRSKSPEANSNDE